MNETLLLGSTNVERQAGGSASNVSYLILEEKIPNLKTWKISTKY
jgi:hypothetical protein